jgi:hypothetical protein
LAPLAGENKIQQAAGEIFHKFYLSLSFLTIKEVFLAARRSLVEEQESTAAQPL